jgi:hypothetical protein
MEELHTDSIDKGHEASYRLGHVPGRGRTPTIIYDSIIIVTNKLTKYAYFIPYFKSFSAEDLAYIFYKYMVANYKFPQRIISNRDKLFTSRF